MRNQTEIADRLDIRADTLNSMSRDDWQDGTF